MNKILLLQDYRNQFWLKTDYKEQSFDLGLLGSEFEKLGYSVLILSFNQIDFSLNNYSGYFVFYQSSEDPGLLYKSFISDILLGLKMQGAILIPDFEFFLSHHNKVFMEILRELKGTPQMKELHSKVFGTYEDLRKDKSLVPGKKYVFKSSAGAQSKGVRLLENKFDFYRIPWVRSLSFNLYYWIIDQIKPLLKRRYLNYRKKSHNRKKFVIQEYLPGLLGDFKVLVLNDKIFVLSRKVRKNDFRASGSGLFTYNRNLPNMLLDFSLEVFISFSVPFISLDIAISDSKPYLIEFQFISFGTYTVEKSPFHFIKVDDGWKLVDKTVVIETEFANAIHSFIQHGFSKIG